MNNAFLKFVLGFFLIIGLGLFGVYASEAYSENSTDIKSFLANFFS